MHGFDMANGLKSVSVRDATTTPTQALLLFNGRYALKQAELLVTRLMKEEDTLEKQVERAFLLVWNRLPSAEAIADAREFVGEDEKLAKQRLVDFCHVLFNSNQFLYLD